MIEYRESSLHWPTQRLPGPISWEIWHQFLTKYIANSHARLHQPLISIKLSDATETLLNDHHSGG